MDKVQGLAVDVTGAKEKDRIEATDFVIVTDSATGKSFKIRADNFTSAPGAINIRGLAMVDDPATTETSIVVENDPNNATIEVGTAPAGVAVVGAGYLVITTNESGIPTKITGSDDVLFNEDQVIWIGSRWAIFGTGNRVLSVNNKTGHVSLTASDVGALPDTTEIPDISNLVPNTRTVNKKSLDSNIELYADDVGAVPKTRTVNGNALDKDIKLTASDVGAQRQITGGTAEPDPSGMAENDVYIKWE